MTDIDVLLPWELAAEQALVAYTRPTLEDDVREFMAGIGQAEPTAPAEPNIGVRGMRMTLIDEEMDELIMAYRKGDLVAIADALADLVYVLVGMAVAYGIPFQKVWDTVHESNMAKVGMAEFREDGKYLKPDHWEPPDLRKVLLDAATDSLLDKQGDELS